MPTTNRVGFHRYTFKYSGQADIILNIGGPAGPANMRNGSLTRVSATEIEVHFDRTDGIFGGPSSIPTFFVIVLDK